MTVEVEAKWTTQDTETPAESLLAELTAAAAGYATGNATAIESRALHDVYLDTPERAILRSGHTLRIRRRPDRPDGPITATIKALDRSGPGGGTAPSEPVPATPGQAVFARLELEGEVESGDEPLAPDGLPEPLRTALDTLTGGLSSLEPVLVLDQVRAVRALGAPDSRSGSGPDSRSGSEPDSGPEPAARPVGELSVDDVRVSGADGHRIGAFREIELERLPGAPPGVFETLVARVAERPELAPSATGKLERGLQMAADHVPGRPAGEFDIRADLTVAEAGRLVWRKQLTTMLLTEAGARRGEDIEFVHDMRVATRRARAAWMHYGAAYDERAMRRLLKGLKATARTLGVVRDMDVALDALAQYARRTHESDAAGLEAIAARWRRDRAEGYDRLLAWLDDKAYRRFIKHMARHCATPGAHVTTERPADLVRHALPAAVLHAFDTVRAYGPHFDGDGEIEVETLHALRIDGKRLRYAIEPLAHLMGADGKEFVKTLKRMQDVLGDLNDASVAEARLTALAAEGMSSPALDRYLEHQRSIIERCRETAESVWRPLTADESRQRLIRSVTGW